MTYTALVTNQPSIVLSVCSCCTGCGEDMVLAPGSPVICKTCGYVCSCPGCHAEQ